jgi:hypothetical protein
VSDYIQSRGSDHAGATQVFPSTSVLCIPMDGEHAVKLIPTPAAGYAVTIRNESFTGTNLSVFPGTVNTIAANNGTLGSQTIAPGTQNTFTYTAGTPDSWVVT